MANFCSVEMMVKGNKLDMHRFIIENKIYLGKGNHNAEKPYSFWNTSYILDYDVESEDSYIKFYGEVKWSVSSTFKEGNCYEEKSLVEVSKEYNLAIEYYSEESGNGFQEYGLIINGKVYEDNCVSWFEICIDDYDTYDEMARAKEMKWLFINRDLLDFLIYEKNHKELIPLRTRKNRGKLKKVLKKIYKPLFVKAKQEYESFMSIGGYDEWVFGEY